MIERSEARLARLQVSASYECRPRNRVERARTSEHGTGNALDLRALVLTNGKTVVLTEAAADKALRSALAISACTRFSTVLGPGSDLSHENHIHLDVIERRSGFRICQWNVEQGIFGRITGNFFKEQGILAQEQGTRPRTQIFFDPTSRRCARLESPRDSYPDMCILPMTMMTTTVSPAVTPMPGSRSTFPVPAGSTSIRQNLARVAVVHDPREAANVIWNAVPDAIRLGRSIVQGFRPGLVQTLVKTLVQTYQR